MRCTASSLLSEYDQMIGSSEVPSSKSEAVDRIHRELCLRSLPSILQRVNNLFVPQEASSYDIQLQTFLFEQLFLLEQPRQLAFHRNCGYLHAQQDVFFSLNENLAQHSSLDLIFSCFDISLRVSPCRNQSVRRTFQNFLHQCGKFPSKFALVSLL